MSLCYALRQDIQWTLQFQEQVSVVVTSALVDSPAAQVPVSQPRKTDSQHLLGIQWDGAIYVDCPFDL